MSETIHGEEWRAITGAGGLYDLGQDADILAKARANIPRLRMRDVALRVSDRQGRPLANVPVQIEQMNHAFLFGDQLWPLDALYRDGRGASGRARA
jgi:transcription initiation factor TFIIIB Brf1 subunit/transcription initiation factor TFIIB